jgi:hypothetical protein
MAITQNSTTKQNKTLKNFGNVRWVTDRRAVTSAQADNWIGKRIGKRKVDNRPPGGYVGDSPTTGSPNRTGKTKTPYVLDVLVLPMRVPPHCFRLASLAENATAQRSVDYLTFTARQSVAHLTITTLSWRSVQTFLVLLRTEAGGMPAFQSVTATR